MDTLTDSLAKSLIVNEEDAIKECLELGIDFIFDNDMLKSIPIVNIIVGGAKTLKNMYDRSLLEKTLAFIEELNNGTISKDKLIAYRATIENNPQKCQEEMGRVLTCMSVFLDKSKSQMLAKAFKAYINKDLNWDEFCEYSEIINRIFIQDLDLLFKVYKNEITMKDEVDEKYRIERLTSLGLITQFAQSNFSFGTEILDEFVIKKTKLGDKFVRIIE